MNLSFVEFEVLFLGNTSKSVWYPAPYCPKAKSVIWWRSPTASTTSCAGCTIATTTIGATTCRFGFWSRS